MLSRQLAYIWDSVKRPMILSLPALPFLLIRQSRSSSILEFLWVLSSFLMISQSFSLLMVNCWMCYASIFSSSSCFSFRRYVGILVVFVWIFSLYYLTFLLISSNRFSIYDLGFVLGLYISRGSSFGSENDLDWQGLMLRQACRILLSDSTMHQVKSFSSTGWYRMVLLSTSTMIYWASSSLSLMTLLSANRARISSRLSSFLLMEQIMGNGNSNIIYLTRSESQFSSRVSEYWKGEIRLIKKRADRVEIVSFLLRKTRVFWHRMAVSIRSISSQEKLEKKMGQQYSDMAYRDLKPYSGRVPKQQADWQQTWLQSGFLVRKQLSMSLIFSFFYTSYTVLPMFQIRMFSFSTSIFLIMILDMIECARHRISVCMLKKGQQVTTAQIFSPIQISFSFRWQFFSSRMYRKSGSFRHTMNSRQLGFALYRNDFRKFGFS